MGGGDAPGLALRLQGQDGGYRDFGDRVLLDLGTFDGIATDFVIELLAGR
jgi:hypothetical protein